MIDETKPEYWLAALAQDSDKKTAFAIIAATDAIQTENRVDRARLILLAFATAYAMEQLGARVA